MPACKTSEPAVDNSSSLLVDFANISKSKSERPVGGGGWGWGGGVGVTSYILHSMDVRAEWPPFFSAARYIISPLFSTKSI